MGNYDFESDLKDGEDGEKIVAVFLSLQGLPFLGYNKDYRYDLRHYSPSKDQELLFEVKTDDYCTTDSDTGNIAVEIEYKSKPSGLSKTYAQWFVYYYKHLPDENIWMIQVDNLKELIKNNRDKVKIVYGGDNNDSRIVLIPRNEFRDFFGVDTIKKTYESKNEETKTKKIKTYEEKKKASKN
tara:strand:+ start:1135 stop:1683 length:549 start_codon:yes stop_codon:yes gene_type:complete